MITLSYVSMNGYFPYNSSCTNCHEALGQQCIFVILYTHILANKQVVLNISWHQFYLYICMLLWSKN